MSQSKVMGAKLKSIVEKEGPPPTTVQTNLLPSPCTCLFTRKNGKVMKLHLFSSKSIRKMF